MIRSMTALNLVWLLIFWGMQVVAQLIFKWGTAAPGRFIYGFIGGNVFGASSIVFLMLLYRAMNPNVVLGISTGGGFLLAQVALAIVFHSRVAPVQQVGVVAIAAGMLMLAMGGRH
jgi:multidrug transporter EmrE-like cation transporter